MQVTEVHCHVLMDPAYDPSATSSAQDTLLVEVETDEGITGIGETDLNAWIARACIEAPGTHTMDRGLRSMLLGRNPLDIEAIWQELYRGRVPQQDAAAAADQFSRANVDHFVRPEHLTIEHPMMKPHADNANATVPKP